MTSREGVEEKRRLCAWTMTLDGVALDVLPRRGWRDEARYRNQGSLGKSELADHPLRGADEVGVEGDGGRQGGELVPRQLPVAHAVRHRLLRDRVHGHGREPLRFRALRDGAAGLLTAPGGRPDLRWPPAVQARP